MTALPIIAGSEAFGAVIIRPDQEQPGCEGIDVDIVSPGITHPALAYVLRQVADQLEHKQRAAS